MSARKTSLTDKQTKNGTSKYVLERCASINEYYDIAFKVCISALSCVLGFCFSLWCCWWNRCMHLIVALTQKHLGVPAAVTGALTLHIWGMCTICKNSQLTSVALCIIVKQTMLTVCTQPTEQTSHRPDAFICIARSPSEPVHLSRWLCPPFLICKYLLRVYLLLLTNPLFKCL